MKQRPSLEEIFSQPASAYQAPQDTRPSLEEIFSQPAPKAVEPKARKKNKKEKSSFTLQQEKRGRDLFNIVNATRLGEQTIPEGIFQTGMHVVGTAGDVVGEGVNQVAKRVLPFMPRVQEDLEKIGGRLQPYVERYEQNVENYNRENPRSGRNLQAVREMGAFLPFASPVVRSGVVHGAKASGEAIKNVAKDSIEYPVDGISSVAKGIKPSDEAARNAMATSERNVAKANYQAVRDSGAEIKSGRLKQLVDDIDTTIAKRGRLNESLHPRTIAILKDLRADLDDGILDVSRLDENRKLLSRVKKGMEGAEDYGTAQAAVRVINDFEKGLTPSDFAKGSHEVMNNLFKGRHAAHKAIKLEKINEIIQKADGDPNKLKSGLTSFVNKEKNLKGFSDKEVKALKVAARNTQTEKMLKTLGKFGIDLGSSMTAGNTVAPVLGGVLGGAPVVGAGTAARQLQKYMARGKAEKVLQQIKKGKMPKELAKLPPKEVREILEKAKK